MILELATPIFEATSPEDDKHLRRLFDRLDGRRRDAVLLDAEELESDPDGPIRAWTDRLGEAERLTVHEHLVFGPLIASETPDEPSVSLLGFRRSRSLRVKVERRPQSDWVSLRLNVEDTVDLLTEPIHMYLENTRHDFSFLTWLAPPALRREIKALEDAPARQVVHGGGTGELAAFLSPLVKKNQLAPAEMRRLWRSWVMFDKDAGEHDAREVGPSAGRLIALCEEVFSKHGIPLTWVCLQRREIESYTPDDGIRMLGDRQRRPAADLVRRWRAREDRQEWAWAYDMKNGLYGDLRGVEKARRDDLRASKGIPERSELKAPFDGLERSDRRILAAGLGSNLLNNALDSSPPPSWLEQLGNEYDRGPIGQLAREALIQSILDRC